MAENSPKKNYELLVPEGTKDLTIREGAAIHPRELAIPSFDIKGSLQAPFNFLVGKPTLAEKPENIHMLIDLEKGKLELNIGDMDPFSKIKITGELTKFADLAKFRINTDQRWTPQDFMKFIRTVKVFFAEKTEVAKFDTYKFSKVVIS